MIWFQPCSSPGDVVNREKLISIHWSRIKGFFLNLILLFGSPSNFYLLFNQEVNVIGFSTWYWLRLVASLRSIAIEFSIRPKINSKPKPFYFLLTGKFNEKSNFFVLWLHAKLSDESAKRCLELHLSESHSNAIPGSSSKWKPRDLFSRLWILKSEFDFIRRFFGVSVIKTTFLEWIQMADPNIFHSNESHVQEL